MASGRGTWRLRGAGSEKPAAGAVAEAAASQALAVIAAIDRSQAVAELGMDGIILHANGNFLGVIGYTLEEVRGKHAGLLVDPAHRASEEYRQLWEKLARGEFFRGRYKYVGKGGNEAWLEASYNPILGADGRPLKVMVLAADITAQKNSEQLNSALKNSLDVATAKLMANDKEALQTERELQTVVTAVIEGDLEVRIGLDGKAGFFAMLSQRINLLIESFAEVVGRVQSTADEVARGVQEISQGNADLSERTEAQASSLEQTASSMEQMTATVRQNADNSGQANQLAVAARDQADKGGAVVAKAVRAMSEINQSSKKIADIIGVIDEIAFQTNLLALNAAVEAARAGEQGRGFAVVASEVRSLAGRSATAAKEIKGLINDSVQKVEEGSSLVAQSGQTLEQIVSAVKKVSDIIAEIAASSHEQSTGIAQVNKAVMQLDEMTQQNAALVEQATAASQSIADQSRDLSDVMAKYKVTASRSTMSTPARSTMSTPAAPRRAGGATDDRRAARAANGKTGTANSDPGWKQF
jgi:methyl-accepting chemotaxis protein